MADVGIRLTATDATGGAFGSVLGKLDGLKAQASGVGESIGGLVGKFNALGIAIGGAMSLASIKGVIDTADEFGKLAQKTGVSVEALTRLNYAASLSQVSTESLSSGLNKLSKTMALAAGGGKAQQEAFDAIGISVKGLDGTLKSADTVMGEVASKFASFKDSPEKAALAMELFGKRGAELIPLLNQGGAGLKQMGDEAASLGAVFGGDLARNAEQFNDNLTRIGVASKAATITIVGELLPTLNSIAEGFLGAQKSGGGFASLMGKGLRTALELAAVSIAEVLIPINALGFALGAFIPRINALAHLDFKGFTAISDAMYEDIALARKRLEDFQRDILNAGTLTGKRMDARTDPRSLGVGSEATAPVVNHMADGAGAAASAYDTLNKALQQRLALEQQEAAFGGKLTDARKFEVESLSKITGETSKLTEAQKAQLTQTVASVKAEIEANALRDAQAKQALDIATARQAVRKAEYDAAQQAYVASIEADNARNKVGRETLESIEFETKALTMNTQQREVATAMRDLERQGIVKGTAAWDQYAEAIGKATGDKAALAQSIDSFKSVWASVDQTAHDVFVNIFEGGQNAFTKLRDVLKSTLLDLLYQMTLRKWIFSITAAVTGTASGVAGAVGQGSNIVGLASNASTLYSAASGTGLAGTVGSGVGALFGTTAGNTALGTTLGLGYGSSAAAATAATEAGATAGATAATGALAAVPVAGWIALAVVAAYELWGKGGETRSGASYGLDSAGKATKTEGPSGGEIASAQVKGAIEGTATGIQALLKDMGSTAILSGFSAGLETSVNNKGFVFAGGQINGQNFGEPNRAAASPSQNYTAAEAVAAFGVDLQKATLEALAAATDLPKSISAQLKDVNIEGLDAAGVKALSDSINTIVSGVHQLAAIGDGTAMKNLAGLSFDVASGLIAAAGGFDAFKASVDAAYPLLYSESERAAAQAGALRAALANLGEGSITTLAQLRAEIEAQDLTTTSGQNMAAALYALAPAMGAVAQAADAARQQMASALQNYGTSAEQRNFTVDTIQQSLAQAGLNLTHDQIANASRQDARDLYLQHVVNGVEDPIAKAIMANQQAFAGITSNPYQYTVQSSGGGGGASSSGVSAADSIKSAWQSITDSVWAEAQRIRGLLAGTGADAYAASQAKFAITLAQARAGDQEAYKALPGLSQNMLTLADANAASLLDLKRIQARTAGSLESVAAETAAKYDLQISAQDANTAALLGLTSALTGSAPSVNSATSGPDSTWLAQFQAAQDEAQRTSTGSYNYLARSFAVGTSYVPHDMFAAIHAGEEITPRPYVDAQRAARDETNALLQQLIASDAETQRELAAVRAELSEIKASNARIARVTEKSDAIGPAPARATL